MALVFENDWTQDNADAPGTTGTVTVSGATSGNTLVAATIVRLNQGSWTGSPSGWTLRESNDTGTVNVRIWTRTATGDSNDNFTESWTTSNRFYQKVWEVSGVGAFEDSASYQDADSTQDDSSIVTGDATAAGAGHAFVLRGSYNWHDADAGIALATGTIYSYRTSGGSNRPGLAAGSYNYASGGTKNDTWSWTEVTKALGAILLFEAPGGATEVAASFGAQAGGSFTADATAFGQSADGASQFDNMGADASALALVSHQAQLGVAVSSVLTAFATIQDTTQEGFTTTGEVVSGGAVEGSVTFGATLAGTKTADATAYASVLAGAGMTGLSVADASAEALLTAGALLGYSAIGEVVVEGVTEGSVTFSAQMAATAAAEASAEAAAIMTVGLASQLVAEAAAQAGINFGTVADISISGSVISGTVTTPEGRRFTVTADIRRFNVLTDTRIFNVDD